MSSDSDDYEPVGCPGCSETRFDSLGPVVIDGAPMYLRGCWNCGTEFAVDLLNGRDAEVVEVDRQGDTYQNAALERGRPREPCGCDECGCGLHTFEGDDVCIWCRNGDHAIPWPCKCGGDEPDWDYHSEGGCAKNGQAFSFVESGERFHPTDAHRRAIKEGESDR